MDKQERYKYRKQKRKENKKKRELGLLPPLVYSNNDTPVNESDKKNKEIKITKEISGETSGLNQNYLQDRRKLYDLFKDYRKSPSPFFAKIVESFEI